MTRRRNAARRREGRARPTSTPPPTSPRCPNALLPRARPATAHVSRAAAASAVRRAPHRSPARPTGLRELAVLDLDGFILDHPRRGALSKRFASHAPGDCLSGRNACGRTWASSFSSDTGRRLDVVAGLSAQTHSIASKVDE
jgi:hypothetical protein